jgi:hypothetical protein
VDKHAKYLLLALVLTQPPQIANPFGFVWLVVVQAGTEAGLVLEQAEQEERQHLGLHY